MGAAVGPEGLTPSACQNLASAQAAWLTEVLEQHQSKAEGELNVQFPVQCVSALGKAALGGLRSRVEGLVLTDGDVALPSVYQSISRTVYLSTVRTASMPLTRRASHAVATVLLCHHSHHMH